MVRASTSQSVDLDVIPLLNHSKDFKKWYSELSCLALSMKEMV